MRELLIVAAVAVGCGSPKPVKLAPLPDDKPVEAPKPPPVEVKEAWSGTLAMPHDLIHFAVNFTGKDSTWTATFDVPGGVTGIALSDVKHSDTLMTFVLAKPKAPQMNELYKLQRAGDAATGVVVIAGQPFYARMVKLAAGEAPKPAIARPQTPKGPFPYTSREVAITAPESGSLAGTLTIPEGGKGPFPAILLVSGSGQQDRDETIFGHKAFAVLADRFTRDGIAVLRTDDRGMGKTTGALGSLDTDIGDARAAIEWLLKQPEVDPKRVGILGHSIGGVIAPIVAERTRKVAFIIALAGPGVSGVELVPMQLELELGIRKAPDAVVKVIVASQRKVGAAIAKGKPDEVKATLRQSAIDTAAALGIPKPSDAELDSAVASQLPSVTNPWVVSFFKTDPVPSWRKIRSPVLLVIGEKDTQVPPDVNLAKVTGALKRAGNRDVTAEKRPGLNHLYQHATTGLLDEYGMIEETFDPATLDLVAKWLVTKSKKR